MTTYNTGNPIPSKSAEDQSDNCENFDLFSNGQLDAYADRLGVMRQSLQGIRNASQYVDLGPYASGLVFTSRNQVFSYAGEFYAPGPTITLPYTTTGAGAGEIANFRSVGDAVLRADLAAPSGSTLIGDGNRTVREKFLEIPSVFDYMSAAEIADVKSLSPVLDHTAAFQAAINGTSGKLDCGDGFTYRLTRLIGRSNLQLFGSSVLDFSGNATYANTVVDPLFKIWGTAGPATLCTANVSPGALTLTVASTAGIAEGDLVEVATPADDGGFVDTSVAVRNGEICQVLAVPDATTVVLAEPILDATGYTTANAAQVRKLNTVDNIVLGHGLTIRGKGRPQPTGAGDNGVVIRYGRDCKVHCNFEYTDLAAVRFEGCYNYEASGGTIVANDKGINGGVNYGVVPSGSSKHGNVFRYVMHNMRHGIVTSHLSSALGLSVYGVVRNLNIYENTICNTWHGGIATHNDVEFVDIYDNTLIGCFFGVNTRDRNARIIDNKIIRCSTAIYLSARPMSQEVRGNTAYDCIGGLIATSFSATRDITDITISGNEALRCGGGITLILATPISGHRRINIVDNKFKEIAGAGGSSALVRITGAPVVDSTIADNVAYDCTATGGVAVDTGSTRLQITGNNMKDVALTSFSTIGTFTNCYGKANFGTSWSGSANMTNTATLIADNTLF